MIPTVYAVDTRVIPLETGGTVTVRKGTHWAAEDPFVRSHPELFSQDPRYGMEYTQEPAGYGDPPVEQATAAPGERRNTRRAEPRG
jgi:hypothetical protein